MAISNMKFFDEHFAASSDETRLRNELEDSLEHNLSEGTVESLLRAKNRINSVLDALIARAIGEV